MRMWYDKHGPPSYSQKLLADVGTLLQALYTSLPLDRITKVVGSASSKAEFVRSYRRAVCDRVQKEGALTPTGGLDWDRAESVLVQWLRHMCTLKGKSDLTKFEWHGFYLLEHEITESCQLALRAVWT